jgi:hypothetical protein
MTVARWEALELLMPKGWRRRLASQWRVTRAPERIVIAWHCWITGGEGVRDAAEAEMPEPKDEGAA